jgi:hypothetical protein
MRRSSVASLIASKQWKFGIELSLTGAFLSLTWAIPSNRSEKRPDDDDWDRTTLVVSCDPRLPHYALCNDSLTLDDAIMATLNADAANDLGSQNAFYDPNVHVNFNDTSILHSAHQQHHFAPWDIPAFPHNVPQINPFEIPPAPDDVSPDSGSIMTRRRRAMLHRQSALIDADSSTAQVGLWLPTRNNSYAYHTNYALYFSDVYVFRAAPLSFAVRRSSAGEPHRSAVFSPRLQSPRLTSPYPFESTIMG